MSDTSLPPPDTDALWDELRAFWRAVDPPPIDLTAKVLATIAVEDLDAEYEMLQLLDNASDRAGVRSIGEATDTTLRTSTIQFAHDRINLLLRVSALDDGCVRVDGWIAPVVAQTVTLRNESQSRQVTADASGRFEFTSVPAGPVRLWLEGTDGSFTTTMFEI